jgi:hypothetical protein
MDGPLGQLVAILTAGLGTSKTFGWPPKWWSTLGDGALALARAIRSK